MNHDLQHRIRWRNVARAVLVLAAVALVAAWPRLRAAGPTLPPAATAVSDPVVRTATQALPPPPVPAAAAPRRRPKRHTTRTRHPRRATSPRQQPAAPKMTRPPAPRAPAAAPPPDTAAEFRP